ncbi:hypothetical protein ACEWY4_004508 [Coilia grayii]|uniref:Interleukin-7 receptor subunit alpha n=1 Tax=Coilia grayii TaxID=363190 RepID=A0ABD1KLZ7_9TELE
MAREVVWTLVLLLLGLCHGQSGDGPEIDEEPDMDCISELSLKGSYLICTLTDELIGTNLTISSKGLQQPLTWTLNESSFTLPIKNITDLISIFIPGKVSMIKDMTAIVKLPAPLNVTATYLSASGDGNISVQYQHDYVESAIFEVDVWNTTVHMPFENFNGTFIIPWKDLKMGSEYFVKMRVKPIGNFSGRWSGWSPCKSFIVDKEPTMDCFSELIVQGSYLHCTFTKELIGTNISISSVDINPPLKWTLNGSNFRLRLKTIINEISITIPGKGWMTKEMKHIVKLPAPRTVTATYLSASGNANITVQYHHDYVTLRHFEVYIWNATSNMIYDNFHGTFIIPREDLKAGSEYFVKVRVRPGEFFNGRWSDWSTLRSFIVDKDPGNNDSDGTYDRVLMYIIVIVIVISIVLLIACLLTRLRGQKLKAYIMPNVPHPKTTLVHMQKFNKGLLLSFTPETFNDIHINRLDEGGGKDKALAPESTSDDQRAASPRSHCQSQLSQVPLWQPLLGTGGPLGESQSTLQDEDDREEPEEHGEEDMEDDVASAEVRLLGDGGGTTADSGDGEPSSTSIRAVQEGRKDEAYVTMSSLFKTQ